MGAYDMEIVFAAGIVAIIGLVCGLGLSLASKVMAVPVNEKTNTLRKKLPSLNCGACGYSGCDGYAAAMAENGAAINLCTPGGDSVSASLSKILGTKPRKVDKKTAMILCNGSKKHTGTGMQYQGIKTCAGANMLFGGDSTCSYGCLGYGDCADACDYDAITIKDGLAIINPIKCTACGKCVNVCPKQILALMPSETGAIVRCTNKDRGSAIKAVCEVGCIACLFCVKICKYDAIKVENNLARIDPEKCVSCGACGPVCPMNTIQIFN